MTPINHCPNMLMLKYKVVRIYFYAIPWVLLFKEKIFKRNIVHYTAAQTKSLKHEVN